jgi:Spy/CpxP family protein refolding chaperone
MSSRVSWSHPKVLTALLAVFLAGAASGALVMKFSQRTSATAAKTMRHMDRAALLAYFRKELDLTVEQQKQVETLLDDHFKYLQTLGAQMEEVRHFGRDSIAKLLTPEQRKRFDKLMTDWQRAQR